MNQCSFRIGRKLALLVGVAAAFLGAVPAAQATDKIFWANFSNNSIYSTNLDGSGGTDQLNPGSVDTTSPSATALDLVDNRAYFANGFNHILFMALDDSGGGGFPGDPTNASHDTMRGMVVDKAAGRIYWANEATDKISYMALDASSDGNLDTTGATVSNPAGVALDKSTGRIYWANGNDNTHAISYTKLDGSGGGGDLDISGATASNARGPSIDAAAGKIYWANFGNNTISYANLAGGGGGQLPTTGATVDQPHGTALDAAGGKIYWTNFNGNKISSANLDGSGGGSDLSASGVAVSGPVFPSILKSPHNTSAPDVTGASSPGRALPGDTLDCSDGTWAGDDTGALLYRAPRTFSYQWLRDGTPIGGETNSSHDVTFSDIGHDLTCRVSASNPAGSTDSESNAVTVDPIRAERVFWATSSGSGRISYANLDGSGGGADLDTTGGTVVNAAGIAIDSAAGKIYWSEETGGASIGYANLDGSGGGGELNLGAAPIDSNVHGIAVDPVGGRLYWGQGGHVAYANLDGSGGAQLTTTGATVSSPTGFAVDRASGRLYWTNAASDTHPISYANLDGSGGGGNLDTTGATASVAWGLAISGGKVYWANEGNSTISYANLSGGGGGQLTTGQPVSSPFGLAIDGAGAGATVYWAGFASPDYQISYSALDGSAGGVLDTSGTSLNAGSQSPVFPALLEKPKNTVAPSITGLQSAGHTITCDRGSWPDDLAARVYRAPESYDYQWLKDNVAISGETANTYSVQAGDTGHVLKCRVTGTNLGGVTTATSAGATIQVPPSNTALPTITGTPAPGHTLTCNNGSWSGSGPQAYSYRWLRNGAAITGATSTGYLVKSADAGKQLSCRVTASNNGGSAMATSAAKTIKTPPKNTVAPKITGTPKVGRTLTCAKGTWTGSAPITYKYQWLRNGAPIVGATSATYVAKAADQNKLLSCKVTATNAAGSASKTTAAVKIT